MLSLGMTFNALLAPCNSHSESQGELTALFVHVTGKAFVFSHREKGARAS